MKRMRQGEEDEKIIQDAVVEAAADCPRRVRTTGTFDPVLRCLGCIFGRCWRWGFLKHCDAFSSSRRLHFRKITDCRMENGLEGTKGNHENQSGGC
jgi:hypothetical protein